MRRLLAQMLLLLAAAFALGFGTNAVRGTVDPGGNDPELLKRREIERIAMNDAALHVEDGTVLFLDVRPQMEYEMSHIRGAAGFSSDDFAAAYAEIRDFLAPELQIVLYGDATLPAVRAAEFLVARGHTARVLDGGWRGWVERGLPVEGAGAP